MKKKRICAPVPDRMLLKLWKIMRLSVFFLFLFVAQTFATVTYSQQTRLTLKMQAVKVIDVLGKIEDESQFYFLFNQKLVDVERRVDVDVKNESIDKILSNLFNETNVSYLVRDRQIILTTATPEMGVSQQQKSVTGKVTDSSGSSLPGVSIVVKGTTNGTITDGNGNYSFSNVPENATLQFSFVGMKAQEVAVAGKTSVNVKLEEEMVGIEEVIAVGYGTIRKRDVTTSIASIGGADFKDMPVGNFDQALAGKMSGVQVIQNSGKPNSGMDIRVRGTGSITAGIEPLYVVDGVPLDRASGASEIADMNDIESIEVLKDASSAAIYGSRGSNGVVIITTKKGKEGKTKIEYQGSYGIQEITKQIPMLDAYQYASFSKDGHNGAYLDAVPTGNANDPNSVRPNSWDKIPPELLPYLEGQQGLINTNWQDEIYRTSPITKHSLSASGGNEKSQYYISGNYLSQDGIIINSDYKRYGARLNYAFKAGKTKTEINFSPSYSVENRVNSDDFYGNEGVVQSALAMCPVWPVYNPDGTYNFQGNGYWRIGTDYQHNEVINPVAEAMLVKNSITHANINGNVSFDWEIVKDIHFKTTFGFTYNSYVNDYYRPSTLPLYGWKFYNAASNPSGSFSNTSYLNLLLENTLNYKKSFEKHTINALAGFTTQQDKMQKGSYTTTGAPNDLIPNAAGGSTLLKSAYDLQSWSLASALCRIQYDYDGKYLFSAAMRTDGSSRFGKKNRWGYFPSVSSGWRIKEEGFMKDITWISNMKLRGSYGVSGNFKIGNYAQTPLLSYNKVVFGSGEGAINTGISPAQFANEDLSWEKTSMVNVGFEMSFIKDRIGFEFDMYNSNTRDLLLNIPVPTITGFSTAMQNIGQVNNKGLEFSIVTHNKFGEFNWNGRYNISANINTVVALGNGNAPIIVSAGTATAYWKTEVGQPIGNYYLLKNDGVFKSQAELDAYPHFANTKVGDFKFIDADGDGVIDVSKDRTIVGNYMPKFTYGFTNDFNYKGLTLSVSFQGVYGNEILNLSKRYIANMEGNINNTTDALNRYVSTENPGNGLTPRATRKQTGNNGTISIYHLEDGSYLRLQNVTFGYNFPKKMMSKLNLQNLRVFASGQNLLTFTKYSGYNPEVNNSNSNQLTGGLDYGSYPLSKTYSIGLNVTF